MKKRKNNFEGGKNKTRKRKTKIIITIIVTGLAGCLFYAWYRATHTGSRSGRVIDAVTGEPLEGAVVNYSWAFSGFMTAPGGKAAYYETTTDKDGYYFIPNQRLAKRTLIVDVLQPERVLIYKNNYAVYKLHRTYGEPAVGRSFGYPDKNQIYYKKDNLVKLYPWKNGESHYEHIGWIDSAMLHLGKSKLLRKEIEEEEKRAREERLSR